MMNDSIELITYEEFLPDGKEFSLPSDLPCIDMRDRIGRGQAGRPTATRYPIIRVREDRRRPITVFVPGSDAVGATTFLIDLFTTQAEHRHSATLRLVRAFPSVRQATYARNWVSQSYASKREVNMTTQLTRLVEKHPTMPPTTFLPDWVSRMGFQSKEQDEKLKALAASQENQYIFEVPIKSDHNKWDVYLLIGDERTLTYIARVPTLAVQAYMQQRNLHYLQEYLESLPNQRLYDFVIPALTRVQIYRFVKQTAEAALFEAYEFASKVPAFYSYQVEKERVKTLLREQLK